MPYQKQHYSAATTHRAQLVYEILRWGTDQEHDLASRIGRVRTASYKRELKHLLSQADEFPRILRLSAPTRNKITTQAVQDASRIVETYNRDLHQKLLAALDANPDLSPDGVRREISAWHSSRQQWKNPQIALYADRDAVYTAQQDFFRLNRSALDIEYAELFPKTAVCPDCQRLIDLGQVSLDVAHANPCPVHVNCVHKWLYRFRRKPGARIQGDLFFQNLLDRFRGLV